MESGHRHAAGAGATHLQHGDARHQAQVELFRRSEAVFREAEARYRELVEGGRLRGTPRPSTSAAAAARAARSGEPGVTIEPIQLKPEDRADPVSRRGGESGAEVLTARQREVAVLIADGSTNRQIAERLVLTTGTVANHVEHILRRLNLRNRSQIVAWAVRQELGVRDEAELSRP